MIHLLLAIIYASFISLGLPDGLLGAGWPTMYPQFQVPVSYSGIIFLIICVGTVVSSLQSDRLTRRFGTGKVTAFSVGLTALALLGFSVSNAFWQVCLIAIPYGLGAGSVDASLNNYMALHYKSRHMSWLHCMWGVGASIGPYIMGAVLTSGQVWSRGYLYVGIIQLALSTGLFFTLPLWKKPATEQISTAAPLKLGQVLAIPGAKSIMTAFFCYCALEQTVCLWSASYLNLHLRIDPEIAASWSSLFYLGITAGRFISGFVTIKLNDNQMIYLGFGILALGVLLVLLPLGLIFALAGLLLIGLGCAPIYPCIIHSTPAHFGVENSQAMVGVQMASAYLGSCIMPPLFGLIANHLNIGLFPLYLLAILAVMVGMYRLSCNKTA
ncbi:MAG: MFS transporter [Oscillospiraceae bacterium]|nr:MFS transporter [Oscillospiraceae bacterium]